MTGDLKMYLKLEDENLTQLNGRLTEKEIGNLLKKLLIEYLKLPTQMPTNQFVDEFTRFLAMKKKRLAQYPPTLIKALLESLNELQPTKEWELIPEITRQVNTKLSSFSDKQNKPYSGNNIGDLLSDLGFNGRRKGDHGNYVFVDRPLLQYYLERVS